MCLFIETICYDNGLKNISLHQERVNKVFNKFFQNKEVIKIEEVLKEIKIPNEKTKYKIRVLYSDTVKEIKIEKYILKKINKIYIVKDDKIDYEYKFADRRIFDRLKKDKNEIIIIKNGFVTDTSFSNIVFYDKKRLITPSTPLLKGTKRENLLRETIIVEDEIKLGDIKKFSKIFLINAMLDIGEIEIETKNIIF